MPTANEDEAMVTVDLQFQVLGDYLPADHGFLLYSAIASVIPEVHGAKDVGIHHVSGQLTGDRRIALSKRSRIGIRAPVEMLPTLIPLSGKSLRIGGSTLHVGVPIQTTSMTTAAELYSRLVIIKGFMEPEPFLEAARRQLAELKVSGELSLVDTIAIAKANDGRTGGLQSPWLKRTINIHGRQIVGFALRVSELSPDGSLLLQSKGLGGRRRFGCGIFIQARNGRSR
jgi:CRISPR-associated protein Cas6